MVDETSASFFEGGNVLLAIAPARLSTWQQRQEVQGILRKANGETSESNRIRLPPPKTGAGSAYERDLLATEFSSAQRSKSFSPNPMASGCVPRTRPDAQSLNPPIFTRLHPYWHSSELPNCLNAAGFAHQIECASLRISSFVRRACSPRTPREGRSTILRRLAPLSCHYRILRPATQH
jgi:hypothetical protein